MECYTTNFKTHALEKFLPQEKKCFRKTFTRKNVHIIILSKKNAKLYY